MRHHMKRHLLVMIAFLLLISIAVARAQNVIPPLSQETIDELALVSTIPIGDTVTIEESPNQQTLVYVSKSGGIIILDQSTDTILKNLPIGLVDAALAPDGTTLAVAGNELIVTNTQVISLETSNSFNLASVGISARQVGFINQGQAVLLADEQGVFHTFTLEPVTQINNWSAHTGAIVKFIYREPNQEIVSYGEDGHIRVWNTAGQLLRDLGAFSGVTSFADANQSQLAIVTQAGVLALYDLQTGTLVLDTPTGYSFSDVAFNPIDQTLVTVSRDGILRQWDSQTLAVLQETSVTANGYLQAITVSPSNEILVGGIDNTLYAVDSLGAVTQRALPFQTLPRAAVSPDGRFIVSTAYDGTLRVWSVLDQAWIYYDDAPFYFRMTFSPDANVLVGGTLANSIETWSMEPQVSRVASLAM